MTNMSSTCALEGCDKPTRSTKLCPMHHARMKKYGDPNYVTIIVGDDTARFASKVEVSPTGCHLWRGSINRYGYGEFRLKATNRAAHRWAYEMTRGPIPDDLTVDHLCGVRNCVNVDHMELVSLAENVRRGHRRALLARPTCGKGHPWDEANTYWSPAGQRQCRACVATRARLRRESRGFSQSGPGVQ